MRTVITLVSISKTLHVKCTSTHCTIKLIIMIVVKYKNNNLFALSITDKQKE